MDWELQVEGAAGEVDFVVAGAFHPNAADVRAHAAAGDGQSQTGAAALEDDLAG